MGLGSPGARSPQTPCRTRSAWTSQCVGSAGRTGLPRWGWTAPRKPRCFPAPSQKPRSAPAPCRRDSRLMATRAAHRKGLATPPPARRRRAPRDGGDKQHPLSHAGSTRLPTPAGRLRPARRPAAWTPGLGALLGTRSPQGGGSRGFCTVPPARDGPSRSVAIGAGQAGHERPTPRLQLCSCAATSPSAGAACSAGTSGRAPSQVNATAAPKWGF